MSDLGVEDVVLEEEENLHPFSEPIDKTAPFHKRFANFVVRDHPYAILGTFAFSLLGLWFSKYAHNDAAFLDDAGLACVLALPATWIVLSAVALVCKLTHWKTWREWSPTCKPLGLKIVRIATYVVWAAVLVLFVDGPVMSLVAISRKTAIMVENPANFVESSIYMLQRSSDMFATGIITTIELAVFGTIIAFFLALLLVFLRIQTPDRTDNDFVRFLKSLGSGFARAYSTIVRGTPMMVQGMIIYTLGFTAFLATGMSVTQITSIWSVFVAGLVTISLNSTAYMMEVLRGGIESVDGGQMEAARSLGLSQWQAVRKVVFPQGIKNSIPALSNELIINIKDSSVLSVIGVFDLMFATTSVAGVYYRQMEVYVIAAVCYLVLTLVFSKILTILASKLNVEAPGPVMGE